MITIEDYQELITWNLDPKELMGNRDEELGFFRKGCKLLTEMKQDFENDRPHILAGLLDIFSKVLVKLPDIKIDPEKLPRMGDFAHLGEALYQVMGRPEGSFLADFSENKKSGVRRTLDTSPVGQAIQSLMESPETNDQFEGTIKQLLEDLEDHKPDRDVWVKSARGLGDALRRLSPALRTIGINIVVEKG